MESISRYFAADHDRLDALFAEFKRLKRAQPGAAKSAFKEFLQGLTRHIVWEEDVLFPAFERAFAGSGPTSVMRLEHRRIKACLDVIHDKVRAADPESDAAEEELLSLLSAHNIKEESVLYPAIDGALGPNALETARKAMSSIPEERYVCCCHAQSGGERGPAGRP